MKVTMIVCLMLIVSLAAVGIVVSYLNYSSSLDTLTKTMQVAADTASGYLYEAVVSYKTLITEISLLTRLTSKDYTPEQRGEILRQKQDLYHFDDAGYVTTDGMAYPQNASVADRDSFKRALQGEIYISEPYYSDIYNKMVMVISSPIMKDGVVDGVVFLVFDASFLSNITNEIKMGDSGSAYILDSKGITIAHKNTEFVLNQLNTIEVSKSDPSYASVGNMQSRMIQGVRGFERYEFGGVKKFIAYSPIKGSNGWTIGVTADEEEFMKSTTDGIVITIVLVIIAIIIGVIVSIIFANSLLKPIQQLKDAAHSMSEGILTVNISYESDDELGNLADSLRKSIVVVETYIKDISRAMREMANGNFDIAPSQPFIGDFSDIEQSITTFIIKISNALTQMRLVSDKVSDGSEQVSGGAQSLAQGATQQASALDELTSSINDMSSQVQETAENARRANGLASEASAAIANSNSQMQKLMIAMSDINNKSHEISNIIKTIEDIAFQTNILALNAAVEAARAGAAGKGFAVVADEVRNLAGKSAEAAKNTTKLIGDSVNSINEGVKLADVTAKDLQGAVQSVETTTSVITNITEASSQEAVAISQISIGIEQISTVVQANSATSQESAAASEQLSNQAYELRDLISYFVPKDLTKMPPEIVSRVLGESSPASSSVKTSTRRKPKQSDTFSLTSSDFYKY